MSCPHYTGCNQKNTWKGNSTNVYSNTFQISSLNEKHSIPIFVLLKGVHDRLQIDQLPIELSLKDMG